jgi:ubiquinone/menaquinone biosynthesis C-methylase UbiE
METKEKDRIGGKNQMDRHKIFDLDERLQGYNPFDNTNDCRDFDLDSRKSMVIPMQHMMSLLEPYCKDNAKFLDVGCASGLFTLRMASTFENVQFYGIEQSDHLLQVLQENMTLANLLNFKGTFNYEWANFSKFPVADNSADVVYSFSSSHRWPDLKKTLNECQRVCKEDGIVILYDLARDSDEGIISFILQYTGTKHEEFMKALKSSYTKEEIIACLAEVGLSHWHVSAEFINLIVTSKQIDTSYTFGEEVVFEEIFA